MRVTYDHVVVAKDLGGGYGYHAYGVSCLGDSVLLGWWADLQSAVDWVVKEHRPRTIRLEVK